MRVQLLVSGKTWSENKTRSDQHDFSTIFNTRYMDLKVWKSRLKIYQYGVELRPETAGNGLKCVDFVENWESSFPKMVFAISPPQLTCKESFVIKMRREEQNWWSRPSPWSESSKLTDGSSNEKCTVASATIEVQRFWSGFEMGNKMMMVVLLGCHGVTVSVFTKRLRARKLRGKRE